jgi:hypothetical protein
MCRRAMLMSSTYSWLDAPRAQGAHLPHLRPSDPGEALERIALEWRGVPWLTARVVRGSDQCPASLSILLRRRPCQNWTGFAAWRSEKGYRIVRSTGGYTLINERINAMMFYFKDVSLDEIAAFFAL